MITLLSNIFSKKTTNKNKLLLRTKSTVKEKFILDENAEENDINKNISNNKISMNMKKYKNSLNFENDKIKDSSRPINEENTEQDKNGETEGAPRIQTTAEYMMSKSNDNKK